MRELDDKIAAWCAQLAAALPEQEKTVRELEDHLRDHIDMLRRMGMSSDDAFAESTKQLGDSRTIAREFRRVQSAWWPTTTSIRVVLTLMGFLMVSSCTLYAWQLQRHGVTPLVALYLFAAIVGFQTVLTTGLLGACALVKAWRRPLTERETREFRRMILRLSIVSSVFVPLGMVAGMFVSVAQTGRVWSWSPLELRAFLVLGAVWLSLIVQIRVKPEDRVRWLLAVLGNVVLAISYFVMRKSHPWTAPLAWYWSAFFACHVAIAMLRPAEKRIAITECPS